jgi:hypothetical protein
VSNLLKLLSASPEAVVVLLFLVVPGFLFIRVVDALVPGRRKSFGSDIIDIVCYSLTVMGVWFVVTPVLFERKDQLPW